MSAITLEKFIDLKSLKLLLLFTIVVAIVLICIRYKEDETAPPKAPNALPLIGNMRGMLKDRFEYVPRVSKLCGSSIFTMAVPGNKITVVTSPRLAAQVEHLSTTLSWPPIRAKWANSIHGVSEEAANIILASVEDEKNHHGLSYDFVRALGQGLMNSENLDHLTQSVSLNVTKSLDDLQSNVSSKGETIELHAWLRHEITAAITSSIYGPMNPFENSEIADAIWYFSSQAPRFVLFPLPKIFARSAIKAREKLVDAFHHYFMHGGLVGASASVQLRYSTFRKHGISTMDIARWEIGTAMAALVNTVPTCFWMLFYIYSTPGLLNEIRSEVDSMTEIHTAADMTSYRKINPHNVKQDCPLLLSTLKETLRLTTVGSTVRLVLEDTILDGRWLLKKGTYLQIPSRCLHMNEQVWGDDVDKMEPRRYLKYPNGNKQQQQQQEKQNPKIPTSLPVTRPFTNRELAASFRTFGGGLHVCPGRLFATNAILTVCSFFVARFDMIPVEGHQGQWKKPSTIKTNLTKTIEDSDTDIKVYVHMRGGMGGRI